MFLKEVRVSECQTANDTKGKRSTTPRELGHAAKEARSVNALDGGAHYAK
ncbi:hypothetical protein ABE142_22740 [Paenibacillus alvei]|nr:hypothetical protein [Paenibacillus alvei]NEZ40730.1 hypothetical protein [Paenibacillus alvei]